MNNNTKNGLLLEYGIPIFLGLSIFGLLLSRSTNSEDSNKLDPNRPGLSDENDPSAPDTDLSDEDENVSFSDNSDSEKTESSFGGSKSKKKIKPKNKKQRKTKRRKIRK